MAYPLVVAPAPIVFPGIPVISDHEFVLFQSLIRREAGIELAPTKKPMLVSRLFRRMNALKIGSFADYYRHIVCTGESELVRVLDSICTNETWFFRNPNQFNFVKDLVIPAWGADHRAGRRPASVRVWSAGCSSGEEPFSLAMVLLHALPGWEITITATDLSTRALDRAREAIWPLEKSKDIPPQYLSRYMLRGIRSQAGKMKAGPELQSTVAFSRLNLNDELWSSDQAGPFDLIFCRNVLMYFEPQCRQRALQRLLARLSPRGHLFVGDAEGLGGFQGLRLVIPATYTFPKNTGHPPTSPAGGENGRKNRGEDGGKDGRGTAS